MDKQLAQKLKEVRKVLYGHYPKITEELKKHKSYKGQTNKAYISKVLTGKILDLFVLDCANTVYDNVLADIKSQEEARKKMFA